MSSRRRVLSYEERVLWSTFTKAVEPLRSSPLQSGEVGPRSAPSEGSRFTDRPRAPHPDPPPKGERERTTVPKQPQLTPLGRRMKQRVARGKESIDGRLDLHGYTQNEAHAALLRFLRNANARDARLVLVITGKGRGGEPGVLRRQVPQWLGLPEFRSLVIGFEDAHITHGGEGALYVRVRRARTI